MQEQAEMDLASQHDGMVMEKTIGVVMEMEMEMEMVIVMVLLLQKYM